MRVILVLSGKGGVGKSSVACNVSRALVAQGLKIGLLDIDLSGPSIPRMLGKEDCSVMQSEKGWLPVRLEPNFFIMSIGFLLSSRNDAVIWRGPKKHSMINQFINDVVWGDLDYLIVDTPPGTSDEHITIVQCLNQTLIAGAVLVTTPQAVSVADVQREISFCKKLSVPILGVIENMSGYKCTNCSTIANIFSSGGGESLATIKNIPFLGRIPIDPQIALAGDNGTNFFEKSSTEMSTIFYDIVKAILANITN